MAAAVEMTINSREMPPVLEHADLGTGCRDKNMEIIQAMMSEFRRPDIAPINSIRWNRMKITMLNI